MARLWNCGFECAGNPNRIFTSTHGDHTISNTQARTGTYSLTLQCYQFERYASLTIAPLTNELYVGFGLYPYPIDHANRIFQVPGLEIQKLVTTNQIRAVVTAGNFDSPAGVPADAWSHIQIRFLASATLGVIQVKLDGNLVIDQENINTGAAAITYARWCSRDLTVSGGHYQYIDDPVINDVSGSADNGWPGDRRFEGLFPDAVGDESDWDLFPDGGEDDYEDIDEVPADDDTTYLHHDTDTEEFLVNLPAWSGAGLVPQKVHLWACARKEGAAAGDQFRLTAKQGGITAIGSAQALTTSYLMYLEMLDAAPDGGAWSNAKIDALQLGARIHDA